MIITESGSFYSKIFGNILLCLKQMLKWGNCISVCVFVKQQCVSKQNSISNAYVDCVLFPETCYLQPIF